MLTGRRHRYHKHDKVAHHEACTKPFCDLDFSGFVVAGFILVSLFGFRTTASGYTEQWKGSEELLVHAYVGGVADAEGFFELIEGNAAAKEPYGEGVAEVHRGDAPHSDLVAALPDGVLQRLRGRYGTGGAGDDELGRLVVAQFQVVLNSPDRLFGEASDARGEVGAWTTEVHLGGFGIRRL